MAVRTPPAHLGAKDATFHRPARIETPRPLQDAQCVLFQQHCVHPESDSAGAHVEYNLIFCCQFSPVSIKLRETPRVIWLGCELLCASTSNVVA